MIGRVLYTSPFVPPEWLGAHGLQPCRAVPRCAAPSTPEGVCTFAAAFAHEVSDEPDAVIVTTTCDQMRRMAERIVAKQDPPRTFLFNVPATWEPPAAEQLYRDELERLSRFLVSLGGQRPAPEQLAEVMRQYDELRAAVRELRDCMCGREFARAIAWAGQGRLVGPAGSSSARQGKAVALLGGPLRQSDWWIYDAAEQCGGCVALDATDTGERTLPDAFDPAAMTADPLRELARAYFQAIPDVFRRPDTPLHDYLARMLKARQIGGIILVRALWCDLWHAQVQRVRETTGLPVIEIDLGGEDQDLQRTRTRIEALLDIVP